MPAPHNLHVLHGTRDRRRRAAPSAPVGNCPAGEPEAVRRAWAAFRKELPSLAISDRQALLSLARLAVEATRAARGMEAAPHVAAGSKGQPQVAAQVRCFLALNEALNRQLRAFGATPRARAHVPPPAEPREPGGEADLLT